MVKPVGQNGLDLNLNTWTPVLKVPKYYTMDRFDRVMQKNTGTSREAVLEQRRCLAYNDFPGHSFSLDVLGTIDRLYEIELAWVNGDATSVLDTLFWQACYERQHDSLNFLAREKYLFKLADTEVLDLAKRAESRMNANTEKAKTAARQAEIDLENALLDSMNQVDLEVSFGNELEQALMADPTCYDPDDPMNAPDPIHPTSTFLAPAPRPKLTAAGFRRPGGAARIKKMTVKDYIRNYTDDEGKKKRGRDSGDECSGKRSRFDYVREPLSDETNTENPFLKPNDVQDPFIKHLLNRPHRAAVSNKTKRFSVNGTKLHNPSTPVAQQMAMRSSLQVHVDRPFVQKMQKMTVSEVPKEEEESEEEL